MSSDLTICNLALLDLGAEPMLAFTDGTKAAQLCSTAYADTRDAVFRAHPWRCLIRRQALAQELTPPTFKWAYGFTLPADPYCLRVLETSLAHDAWALEGRTLVAQASTVSIAYIARITDVGQYDVLLIEALSARIAARIAFALTGTQNLAVTFFNLYLQKVSEAYGTDSMEGSIEVGETPELSEVRL